MQELKVEKKLFIELGGLPLELPPMRRRFTIVFSRWPRPLLAHRGKAVGC